MMNYIGHEKSPDCNWLRRRSFYLQSARRFSLSPGIPNKQILFFFNLGI
jgi:hypothetical protein